MGDRNYIISVGEMLRRRKYKIELSGLEMGKELEEKKERKQRAEMIELESFPKPEEKGPKGIDRKKGKQI